MCHSLQHSSQAKAFGQVPWQWCLHAYTGTHWWAIIIVISIISNIIVVVAVVVNAVVSFNIVTLLSILLLF